MNWKSKSAFSILILIVLSVASCKKEEVGFDFHYSYYDQTPGRYVIYDVLEVKHDQGALVQHDSLRYQLKTVIGDTFVDNLGRVAREFLRYKRNTVSDPWVLSDVWTSILQNNKAELIEENQRVIKLVFTPTIQKTWNMNAFNSLDPLECYYRDIHEPYTINSISFDSTLVVEQEDFFTLVDYKRKFEIYAKGVGLIRKYYKDLEIQNFDTINGVKNGNELFYDLISFGIE